MSEQQLLKGKTAVVAGGAKNLGGLISRSLAEAGANVVVHYHGENTAADAEKTAEAVRGTGAQALVVREDLTRVEGVRSLFDQALDAFGGVDVAVNTTGMVLRKPIQEAGARLNDGGRIVSLVTSLLAAFTDGYATYAGAKAPLEHFTRAAAKEFASRGIAVNNVAPGPMDTPFFYPQETPERVEFHKSQAMGGRLTEIEDIAPLVKFLVTEGGWITGQTIFANGGYTVR
ncbi:SDR family oxidoreductase [Streptomyces sp. S6]|nr:SDR family oxidoreductase [Streptomyces sp. S6]